jgi:hypothetical protein
VWSAWEHRLDVLAVSNREALSSITCLFEDLLSAKYCDSCWDRNVCGLLRL